MAGKYTPPNRKLLPPDIKQIVCLKCAGQLTLRAKGYTQTLACSFCGTVHDLSQEKTKISYIGKQTPNQMPLIPLGTRGKLHGTLWEVIGFMERMGYELGSLTNSFVWREYLLFNPFKGFRWLSEFNGHWHYVTTLHEVPKGYPSPTIHYMDETFHRNETYKAAVNYVIGEFYWRVKVEDCCQIEDFIHQDRMLSVEISTPPFKEKIKSVQSPPSILQMGEFDKVTDPMITPPVGMQTVDDEIITGSVETKLDSEQIWSLAEYIESEVVQTAFQLQNPLPAKIGVMITQPIPGKEALGAITKISVLGAVSLIILTGIFSFFTRPKTLLLENFTVIPITTQAETKQPLTQELMPETANTPDTPETPQTDTPESTSTTVSVSEPNQFISPSFTIGRDFGVIELTIFTSIDQSWVEIEAQLINDKTGEVYNMEGGAEYYSGYDSDGHWTEGSPVAKWILSAPSPGTYHLSIKYTSGSLKNVYTKLQLREDVQPFSNFLFALTLLIVPALGVFLYRVIFDLRKNHSDEEKANWLDDFWD